MKSINKYSFTLACCLAVITLNAQSRLSDTVTPRTLIVFFDGLRPDYITPEAMPNLYAFKKKGVYGTQHHSVFPTVTRVNSASYSTGSYPATNGLMGNSVYFPEVSKTTAINTGDAEELQKNCRSNAGKITDRYFFGRNIAVIGKTDDGI